jgi:hypothetical protein
MSARIALIVAPSDLFNKMSINLKYIFVARCVTQRFSFKQMDAELQEVKREIAALEAQHKELSLKKELNDSERYDLAQIPLKLARLETRYNTLVTSLATTQGTFNL